MAEFANMKTLFFTNVKNFKKELLEAPNSQINKSFGSGTLTRIIREHIGFLQKVLKENKSNEKMSVRKTFKTGCNISSVHNNENQHDIYGKFDSIYVTINDNNTLPKKSNSNSNNAENSNNSNNNNSDNNSNNNNNRNNNICSKKNTILPTQDNVTNNGKDKQNENDRENLNITDKNQAAPGATVNDDERTFNKEKKLLQKKSP